MTAIVAWRIPVATRLVVTGGEVRVDRPDRARPLAHRRGHPLHRLAAYITDGEDTGHRGLEGKRVAPGEAAAVDLFHRDGAIGEDEVVSVERHRSAEPRRGRLDADEAEQGRARD